jgi:hypothetical protein
VGIFTNTGYLAGIGKLPAPALGGWYFGWYFLVLYLLEGTQF